MSSETRPLENLCSLIADCPHSTPVWTEAGVVVLRNQNIRGGRLDLSAPSFTDEQHYRERIRRAEPCKGDLVITREAPMGEVCMIPDGLRCCLGQRMVLLRPDPSKTVGRYLLYALQSDFVRRQISWAEGTGSTVSNLRIPDLKALKIPVHSFDEQATIADILGSLDDKIELNRHMNKTLEAIAQAIFKSWFADFDPVRAKAGGEPPESICRRLRLTPELLALFPDRLVDSELGEIPEGWCTASLYEIATYINGATYSSFEPNEERRGLPIIKIAELKAGVTAQTKYSDVDMPDKYRISHGDILFSWSGNPDTSIDTFVWAHGPAWLNQHIFRVVPRNELDRSFVLVMLKYMRPTFAEVARNRQTTGLGHVTVSDLKSLKSAKPSDALLVRWHDIVGPILDRAFLAEVESQTLAHQRDALLPKLIAGELRVPISGAA